MIIRVIIAILCLGLAIYLFLWYNNGLGGSLKSKRPIYAAAIIMYIGFVIFSIKAYHFNDTTNREQIIIELTQEFYEFEEVQLNKDLVQKKQILEIQNGLNNLNKQLSKIEKNCQDTSLLIQDIQTQIQQIDSVLTIETDSVIITTKDFNLKFQKLIDSFERERSKENETWFNIFITVVCAFGIFVAGFTFKNKILG